MKYQSKFEKPVAAASTRVKLPIIIWLVLIGNIMAFTEGQILGYSLTGYGWFMPFCGALFILLTMSGKIKFPVLLWVPWMTVVIGYYIGSDLSVWQRSAQLLCPIIVGMAVSTYRYEEVHVSRILQLLKYLSISLFVIILFRLGVPFTGVLPSTTGLAGQAMSAILFCSIFATKYSFGSKNDLKWWFFMASVPVIAVTRTAIVVSGLTLPFTWGPMKLSRRISLVVIIIILGFILFYTPRLQTKTFKSGEGEMSDVLREEDFADSGRFYIWEHFDEQIKRNPWFGYGAGAGERFVRQITNDVAGYPHNDWRLTLYDYGIFGTAIYVLSIGLAVIHAYRKSKQLIGGSRLLFLAGAASFIPFMLIMYTDNIMVYVSFFGNLQFAILGIAYGAMTKAQAVSVKRPKLRRIRW